MKKILLVAILAMTLGACTDNSGARKALRQQGYTNIQTTGYSWFSCGQGDNFSTGFKAVSAAGHEVKGVVCSGLLKGSTIRVF